MSKLDGYKAGDRASVTQEGTIVGVRNGHITIHFDGAHGASTINPTVTSRDHFHLERIAQPVKVGDMVTWGSGLHAYELVAIRGQYAIIWNDDRGARYNPLSDLRHADTTK